MKFGKRSRLFLAVLVSIAGATTAWLTFHARTSNVVHGRSDDLRLAARAGGSAPDVTSQPIVPTAVTTPVPPSERQNAISQIEATPIVFFGRVVDQYNAPVAGARVTYTVHHLSFAGNSPLEGLMTDNSGHFQIRTQGPSITVSVAHPEYYGGKDAERQIDYSNSAADRRWPTPTRENPTLFKLVKKGQTENLVRVAWKEIRLPLDGGPVEIGLGENSLRLIARLRSANAPSNPNEFRRFDWSVIISMPNGGLIERPNPLDFQAPETGYSPQVEVSMTVSSTVRWSSRATKDYFFRGTDGRYGRFQISISGETGFCTFESYLNPSGSRNLEVDPPNS